MRLRKLEAWFKCRYLRLSPPQSLAHRRALAYAFQADAYASAGRRCGFASRHAGSLADTRGSCASTCEAAAPPTAHIVRQGAIGAPHVARHRAFLGADRQSAEIDRERATVRA